MKIFGREIGMALTVGATAEIADMCPDKDLSRIGELFDQPYGQQIDFIVSFIEALNKGYVNQKKLEGENCDRLCREEILALSPAQFQELQAEAMKTFGADSESEIETESKKNME